jgi:hypothetical protein
MAEISAMRFFTIHALFWRKTPRKRSQDRKQATDNPRLTAGFSWLYGEPDTTEYPPREGTNQRD